MLVVEVSAHHEYVATSCFFRFKFNFPLVLKPQLGSGTKTTWFVVFTDTDVYFHAYKR